MTDEKIPIWNGSMPETLEDQIPNGIGKRIRSFILRSKHFTPTITPYLIKGKKNCSAVLVTPGGGYSHRAAHEGKPIALWLNSIGFSAFVLDYRVAPYHHPAEILDAQRALRYIRHHCEKFNIDPKKIGMLGFSAGGHLTATTGTVGQKNFFPSNYRKDDIDSENPLPNWLILCYPVITMNSKSHSGSKRNLIGKNPSKELETLMSAEKQISKNTPPTFIWTTKEDTSVDPINTEMFASQMETMGIECEKHIFPTGKHGLGLALQQDGAKEWTNFCENWMKRNGFN